MAARSRAKGAIMPKRKPADGPYVALAVFCEKVLEEKDGVLTLVRVIDRTIIQRQGSEGTLEDQAVGIPITLVIGLKAGSAKGSHDVQVTVESPDGQSPAKMVFPVLFESEDRGANLIMRSTLVAQHEGVYWFDVSLGGRRLTRIPYRIIAPRVDVV
jgi:hypothetical protein